MKTTVWGGYRESIVDNFKDLKKNIKTLSLREGAAQFSGAVTKSFHSNCKLNIVREKGKPPWMTGNLISKQRKVNNMRNKIKRLRNKPITNVDAHEEADKIEQELKGFRRDYSYGVRKTYNSSWETNVTNLKNESAMATLNNIMKMERKKGIGTMLKPDGTYTKNPGETLEFLVGAHYPTRMRELEVPELDYGRLNENDDTDEDFINSILNYQASEINDLRFPVTMPKITNVSINKKLGYSL